MSRVVDITSTGATVCVRTDWKILEDGVILKGVKASFALFTDSGLERGRREPRASTAFWERIRAEFNPGRQKFLFEHILEHQVVKLVPYETRQVFLGRKRCKRWRGGETRFQVLRPLSVLEGVFKSWTFCLACQGKHVAGESQTEPKQRLR